MISSLQGGMPPQYKICERVEKCQSKAKNKKREKPFTKLFPFVGLNYSA
jgi:hypothetical protein